MGNEESLPNPTQLKSLLDTAVEAAKEPASQILKRFHQVGLEVEGKADGSPVTIADREAESTIRNVLSANRILGSVDILGEEHGMEGNGTRWRWLIDPIDGTRSFINRIPLFGTIVALEDTVEQRPLIGVIHLPVLDLTYAAAIGFGSTCNGSRLSVSRDSRLAQSIIAVGDMEQFTNANLQSTYHRLQELCPFLRGYTDCFGHTLVVSGSVGAMVDPALNPWDVRATQILIQEAGGIMVIRPSKVANKVDALFGNSDLVKYLVEDLRF